MNNLIEDAKERSDSTWRGRDKARARRVTDPSNKGRPIKNSGIYFTEHVLLDPETYDFIVKKKIDRHEPIGAVIRRLALMQKKGEGQIENYEILCPVSSTEENDFDANKVFLEWREQHGKKYEYPR